MSLDTCSKGAQRPRSGRRSRRARSCARSCSSRFGRRDDAAAHLLRAGAARPCCPRPWTSSRRVELPLGLVSGCRPASSAGVAMDACLRSLLRADAARSALALTLSSTLLSGRPPAYVYTQNTLVCRCSTGVSGWSRLSARVAERDRPNSKSEHVVAFLM